MVFFTALLIILCVSAAFWDFLFYKIPNAIVVLIFSFFILLILLTLINTHPNKSTHNFEIVIIGTFFTFVIGFLLYLFRLMGAGDVKLLVVLSPWGLYTGHFIPFILLMCVFSGIIGLIYVGFSPLIDYVRLTLINKLKPHLEKYTFFTPYLREPFQPAFRTEKLKIPVPYGVAICLSAIITIRL